MVAAGWHDISPWWRERIAKVYAQGAKEIVCRVGRRGGKSETMCRIAVAETLYGEHEIGPGTDGVYVILSALRDQTLDRLATIKRILAALGIEDYKPYAERIEFPSLRRIIRCHTASNASVVSMTCIGAMGDEVAHWKGKEGGENPAKEIIQLLKPAMLTCKNSKLWLISSPFSSLDEHSRRFDLGDKDRRLVFHGATWEANPTVTEEETRLEEPDEQTWEREYAAIPMASDESKFFSAALIDAAKKTVLPGLAESTAAGADFAFSKDSSGIVVMSVVDGGYRLEFDKQWKVKGQPLRPTAVVAEAIAIADSCSAEGLACDTHYLELVREETEATGLELVSFPNTNIGIANAYTDVRVMLGRGEIDLSKASTTLIDELKETMGKPTLYGITIEHPRRNGSHGDLARAFVTAMWAVKNGITGDSMTGGARRKMGMGPSRGGGGESRGYSEYADND